MRVEIGGHFSLRLGVTIAIFSVLFWGAPGARAQADAKLVGPLLQQKLQTEPVVAEQLRRFMLARVPPLRLPSNPAQWSAETERLRARELEVIRHGWPPAWIDGPPKFQGV